MALGHDPLRGVAQGLGAKPHTMTCWKCHESVAGPVCVGCGSIQPPPPAPDLFAVLGLKRRWELAEAELNAAWREVSRKVHPDRFAGRSAVERRMSLQWTAVINDARRVLKDRSARARYLATGRSRPSDERGPALDPDFLEEMFELRMEADMDPEGVRPRAEAMQAEIQGEIDGIFQRWEAGGGDLSAVEERLARLKYLDNLVARTHADDAAPAH